MESTDLPKNSKKICFRQGSWKILLLIFLSARVLFSQSPFLPLEKLAAQSDQTFREKSSPDWLQKTSDSEASSWFDVTYDSLALDIDTRKGYLKGGVTILGICRLNNAGILTLDLVNTMHVDSVLVNHHPCGFTQRSLSFDITLDRLYQAGQLLSVSVFYEGYPVPTGFGSVVFSSHSGVPWVFSLSEPYGARDWWPCKNTQSDKADSADIIVTCDSAYKVGSQGVLVSVQNSGNGKAAYHWRERYPIASYLISIAVSDYRQFSNWFHYNSTDSMEVLNYVLPEDYDSAASNLPRVVDMLTIYSSLYGMYPFVKEKYGHSEFASGGMEHQTMTSIGTFDENTVAHELAHQWFGDMITCRTWLDLWLNEGFAQYSTGLYLEKKYGPSAYWNYINNQIHSGMSTPGMIGVPDTSTPSSLFYAPLIYGKGASVLHMLRHVLGDSTFFLALRSYANDPQLMYSTASTQDFQRVCENVSGKNLGYFFSEWIYGEGFPDFSYFWSWSSSGGTSAVTLRVSQPTNRATPQFFSMPIDVRITGPGKDTTVSVFVNAQSQTFVIGFPVMPSSVTLDPDGWVMKLAFPDSKIPPAEFVLEQNYPNPFNSGTKIRYWLPTSADVRLTIYNLMGQKVATLVDSKQFAGSYEAQWSPQNASGVYYCRLQAGNFSTTRKLLLMK